MNLSELTITKAHEKMVDGEFSSVELTKAYLKNIKDKNEDINAFITVSEDVALEQAKQADEMIKNGEAHELTGIPFGVKDAICTEDIRSTGGAKILDNYEPTFNATVIDKLLDKGAVLLGKQNCDAFGHGASNENSMYGPVKNPHDTSKVAGGSSGGSAAAVAADMCLFSIAEDTGGSIRQPASFCGISGLRPSYGRNSRYGIMPMASSLDTVGPMAKTIEGVAILQEVMAGQDKKDATTVPDEVPQYHNALSQDISDMTIGIPGEYFEAEGLNEEVEKKVNKQIESLKEVGAETRKVSLPYSEYAIAVYYLIVPSEDSSNMARLDGVRYGVRGEGEDLDQVYENSRAKGFPDEVKRRIMMGTYALSAGYYDAYYKKAQKVRTLIKQDFEQVFAEVDALITPTSPFAAFDLGELKDDVLAMYLADKFVSPAAVAGVPAISINAGKNKEGLPVGTQIIGPRLQEQTVLNISYNLSKK